MPVLDELGLVPEGKLIYLFFPAIKKFLVFRVVTRRNRGFEVLDYGPLPITSGETLYLIDGGTVTVPADGVLPARSYTPEGKLIKPIITGTYDSEDMFYVPEGYRDTLFHVKYYITPRLIRVQPQLPKGTTHSYFQKSKVTLTITRDWGWRRGFIEVFHIPRVHIAFMYCNDMNIDFYTFMRIIYAEYEVTIPRDPELIYNVLTDKVPSYKFTMPYYVAEDTVTRALLDTYGIEGFPVIWEKERAIEEYKKLLGEVKL